MGNPTLEQVRCFLVDDNDWTEEEFAEFIELHSDCISGEETLVSYTEWEDKAHDYTGVSSDPEPDLINDDHWYSIKEGQGW